MRAPFSCQPGENPGIPPYSGLERGVWYDCTPRFGRNRVGMQFLMRTGLRVALAALAASVAACATLAPVDAAHHAHHHRTPPKLSPQDVKFNQFVKDFRVTAIAAGITPATYDAAMGGIKRSDKIEALTEAQPEFVKPVWSYLDTAASPRRVADGQAAMASQAATLAAIELKYGVPKEILVSIWGNESDYGHGGGEFNIFQALATLAYDGPRSDFGKTQLLAALQMMQQEKLDPSQMVSSWAGASASSRCCRRHSSKARWTETATASAISGTPRPMRWPAPRWKCRAMAGSAAMAGAMR